jgi:elongation factor P
MLDYDEITKKKYIVLDGEPYEVLESHVMKKQRQKPTNQTKLRHLKSGSVVERTFHQSDDVEEADIETETAEFQYNRGSEWWFADPNDRSNRFQLTEAIIGEKGRFLTPGLTVDALTFEDEIFDIRLPIKLDLEVTDAPPSVKGNTAQGGTKRITLSSGAEVAAPLFINVGDTVRVNTETGEYVERVTKGQSLT